MTQYVGKTENTGSHMCRPPFSLLWERVVEASEGWRESSI